MAKRNVVSRTLRSTRKTIGRYLTTGEKSAEATIEQLLDVLSEARVLLAKLSAGATRKRKTKSKRKTTARRKTGARRKKTKVAAAKRAVKRGRAAVRKRRL